MCMVPLKDSEIRTQDHLCDDFKNIQLGLKRVVLGSKRY